MNYETIRNLTIPKIGFGTWKIGGGMSADHKQDSSSLAALRSALELGYTHYDTAEMYGGGHAEELLGRAVRDAKVNRADLFITSKVLPSNLQYERVLRACEGSLRRLGMDYLDLYLIHWPGDRMHLADTFRALNRLVRDGKVRHLGVSNFDLKLLKESQSLSETPILTDQVPFSLSDRSYDRNGVLSYCQQNNILFTAYSPVDEGRLRVSATLRSIAKAHEATPYQIVLAWVVARPRVITIPMSANPKHQAENLAAADIRLSREEMEKLNSS
jgi:diketogulonate reductase-like aldo/keto reductase